jgi:hypothetical protein
MADSKTVVSEHANGVSTKDVTLTLDELTAEKLFAIVKYKHKDRIALHGIVSVQKEMTFLSNDLVKEMVIARFDQLQKQISDRLNKDTSEYFRLLIAKGTPVDQAYKMAYGQ